MNKHSIIPTPHIAETAALALACTAVEAALSEANTAHQVLKDAQGSLCESADFIPAPPTDEERRKMQWYEHNRALENIEAKKLEREQRRITFYGGKIRFLGAIEVLGSARLELVKAVNALRAAVDANDDDNLKLQKEAARCNVVFAEVLLLNSAKTYADLRKASGYGLSPNEHWANGNKIDLTASLAGEYDRNRREWCVMASGHGSAFRFDGPGDGKEVPEGPYLSYDEARSEAIAWECMSDTIGGQAQLYNVRTKQTVGRF